MRRGRSEISERIDSTHHCCFLFMLLCRCCKIQLEGEREIPLRQHSLAQDKLFKQMSLWLRQTNTKSAYYGSGRVAETFFFLLAQELLRHWDVACTDMLETDILAIWCGENPWGEKKHGKETVRTNSRIQRLFCTVQKVKCNNSLLTFSVTFISGSGQKPQTSSGLDLCGINQS